MVNSALKSGIYAARSRACGHGGADRNASIFEMNERRSRALFRRPLLIGGAEHDPALVAPIASPVVFPKYHLRSGLPGIVMHHYLRNCRILVGLVDVPANIVGTSNRRVRLCWRKRQPGRAQNRTEANYRPKFHWCLLPRRGRGERPGPPSKQRTPGANVASARGLRRFVARRARPAATQAYYPNARDPGRVAPGRPIFWCCLVTDPLAPHRIPWRRTSSRRKR